MLGGHIVVAANLVVTKSFPKGNALFIGMPAVKKADRPDLLSSLKGESKRRVDAIENLKIKMGIE